MISVLMSEGLAPSNGAKSQEPPRDASRSSKDEKFSSFMGSRDETSEVDPKKENEVAAAAAGSTKTDQAAPTGEKSDPSETARTAPDAASTALLAGSSDADAIAETAVPSTGDVEGERAATVKADQPAIETNIAAAETAGEHDTVKLKADAPAETTATTRTADAATDLAPRTDEADPRLAAKSDTGTDPKIYESGVRTATDTPNEADLKFTDTPSQFSGDGQSRQSAPSGEILPAADTDIAAGTDKAIADELSTGELADLNARKPTATTIGDDKLLLVNVAREAAPLTTESLLAVAPASGPSAAAPVSTGGLAPTVPTHVIAAPNELTSVVMNALKNGGDVQEQLVVQLDPPELGRVLIDFKFDAQGLQQITVTSENPEALKRLRELHFELTQALKDQGFSDSNLSFQQEARDQSQSNWQAPEWARAQSQVVAAAERSSSASAMPTPPNVTGRDRLDLLL